MPGPYEQGLNGVAPPGKEPKPIIVGRWESWATGEDTTQSQEAEAIRPGVQLEAQAQRYIKNQVEAIYEPEPGKGKNKANE